MEPTGQTGGSLENFRLSTNSAERYVPGGFWRRFIAAIVDGAVLSVLTFPIAFAFGLVVGYQAASHGSDIAHMKGQLGLTLLNWACSLVISFFYYGWFYSNKGGTPGKLLMGLRVVDEKTGTNISYGRAFARETVGKLVSALVLFIGFLMVAFSTEKKALHDVMFGTRVLHKV